MLGLSEQEGAEKVWFSNAIGLATGATKVENVLTSWGARSKATLRILGLRACFENVTQDLIRKGE